MGESSLPTDRLKKVYRDIHDKERMTVVSLDACVSGATMVSHLSTLFDLMKQQMTITTLSLKFNTFNNEGVSLIIDLVRNSPLETLYLLGCELSEDMLGKVAAEWRKDGWGHIIENRGQTLSRVLDDPPPAEEE